MTQLIPTRIFGQMLNMWFMNGAGQLESLPALFYSSFGGAPDGGCQVIY